MRGSICLLFSIFLSTRCSPSHEGDISPAGATTDTSYYIPKDISTNKRGMDTIEINDMKFQPAMLTAHNGDTVIWINRDMVPHCVTEENSKTWTSLPIPAGGSWKMVVTQNSNYYCAIHMVMKGRIVIKDSMSSGIQKPRTEDPN
jgi:plastocyanin